MAYISRFYRLLPGVTEPDKAAFTGGALGFLGYGVFRGDNRTFSVTLAIGTDDTELRELIDSDRFDLAASMLPAASGWVNAAVSEPIAQVHVMAGTINRVRDLVINGKPVVLGFVAVGDALICTNPLYGRGCSLGGVHARLLREALRDHGSDMEALALQMHAGAQEEMLPWYAASVAQDEAARQARRADASESVTGVNSIITEGLLPLTRIDAVVARAFFRMMNLLSSPNAVMQDVALMARVLAYWQTRESRPPEPPMGPSREEMIAALTAAGAVAVE